MRLLIDTQIFIWIAENPSRIHPAARTALEYPGNEVFVSAVTPWEIAIKVGLRRLDFPVGEFWDMVKTFDFAILDVTAHHGLAAGALPRHHADPFDRMLVAQARLEGLTLVSSDALIAQYDVDILPS
ncbi:type II toxin-antitoxin system VapC family toxin [Aerophototrophica crusticola]|uniref:Type II toxin-antitoxin system VapC family toxin n=1 Tax=Aerophototrophica crusticola TaxID=1709002 RepID=A0A858RBC4_9PROT|nr:type II toxin-antitoxin system VapC family toxin [Rhodospirillaceae bacterium B3]